MNHTDATKTSPSSRRPATPKKGAGRRKGKAKEKAPAHYRLQARELAALVAGNMELSEEEELRIDAAARCCIRWMRHHNRLLNWWDLDLHRVWKEWDQSEVCCATNLALPPEEMLFCWATLFTWMALNGFLVATAGRRYMQQIQELTTNPVVGAFATSNEAMLAGFCN